MHIPGLEGFQRPSAQLISFCLLTAISQCLLHTVSDNMAHLTRGWYRPKEISAIRICGRAFHGRTAGPVATRWRQSSAKIRANRNSPTIAVPSLSMGVRVLGRQARHRCGRHDISIQATSGPTPTNRAWAPSVFARRFGPGHVGLSAKFSLPMELN